MRAGAIRTLALGSAAAWLLAGCGGGGIEQVAAQDVITLEACSPADDQAEDPIEGPCDPVADGQSEVTVRVCVPVEQRKSDLLALLSLSSGSWRDAAAQDDGRSLEVDLGEAGCEERSFRTATEVTPAVLVRAELLGFSASQWIQLAPAAVAGLDLAAEPAAFEPNALVKLTAGVRAEGQGQVSDGTEVVFELAAVEPAGAAAWLNPTRVEVADGQAVCVLTAGASAQSITVRATATPPEVEGLTGPDPVSQELVLTPREP